MAGSPATLPEASIFNEPAGAGWLHGCAGNALPSLTSLDVLNAVAGAENRRMNLAIERRKGAHIIASNYLQLFYSVQPTKLLLAA